MLKTRVDRIPVELFNLARERSKNVGQSKTQAYRDIVEIANNVQGMLTSPALQYRKEDDKKKAWDFKI